MQKFRTAQCVLFGLAIASLPGSLAARTARIDVTITPGDAPYDHPSCSYALESVDTRDHITVTPDGTIDLTGIQGYSGDMEAPGRNTTFEFNLISSDSTVDLNFAKAFKKHGKPSTMSAVYTKTPATLAQFQDSSVKVDKKKIVLLYNNYYYDTENPAFGINFEILDKTKGVIGHSQCDPTIKNTPGSGGPSPH